MKTHWLPKSELNSDSVEVIETDGVDAIVLGDFIKVMIDEEDSMASIIANLDGTETKIDVTVDNSEFNFVIQPEMIDLDNLSVNIPETEIEIIQTDTSELPTLSDDYYDVDIPIDDIVPGYEPDAS